MLKYLSIKNLTGSPKYFIKKAIRKNLALLLTVDAMKNNTKLILNAPALTVKSLNGIGVKPAVKIIKKLYCSYSTFILSKESWGKTRNVKEKKFCKLRKNIWMRIPEPLTY